MRDKINWTWKRILGTIFGVLGIGTLTSCYGVYEDDFTDDYDKNYHDIYGVVTGKIDGESKPIKDIVVTLVKKETDKETSEVTRSSPSFDSTSETGSFHFYRRGEGTYELTFNDIDGEENGSFTQKKKEIKVSEEDYNFSIDLSSEE